MRRCLYALVFVLTGACHTAQAFIDPPVLVPVNPVAGQQVSINITAGDCDLIAAYPLPMITQSGDSIRMLLWSSQSPGSDFCNYPTVTGTFAVGTFGVGSYSLQVDRIYSGPSGFVTETLGLLPFVVLPIPATPTLTPIGLLVLFALLLVASVVALRKHRFD